MMNISLIAVVLCLGVLLLLVVLAAVIALQNRQSESDRAAGTPITSRPPAQLWGPAAGSERTLYDLVKDYLRQGERDEAVKAYRAATGANFREAIGAIHLIESNLGGGQPGNEGGRDGDLHSQVVGLLRTGRKIEAIKIYRDATGDGLKESKDAVEAIERTL